MRRLWLVLICAALLCASPAAAAAKRFDRGIVLQVRPPHLVIREVDGSRLRLVINLRTSITLDGRPVRLAQLRRGDVATVQHAGRLAVTIRAVRP